MRQKCVWALKYCSTADSCFRTLLRKYEVIFCFCSNRVFFFSARIFDVSIRTTRSPPLRTRTQASDLQPCRPGGPSLEQSPMIVIAIIPTNTPARPSDPLTRYLHKMKTSPILVWLAAGAPEWWRTTKTPSAATGAATTARLRSSKPSNW